MCRELSILDTEFEIYGVGGLCGFVDLTHFTSLDFSFWPIRQGTLQTASWFGSSAVDTQGWNEHLEDFRPGAKPR